MDMNQPNRIFHGKIMFSPERQVYYNTKGSEVPPTPEPFEGAETLADAREMLIGALAECEKRLRKIRDTYGGESKIPAEIQTEYDAYKKKRDDTIRERDDIEKNLKELRKQGISPEVETSIDDETKTVVDNTLKELDAGFAALRKKQEIKENGYPGDPMHGPAPTTPMFADVPDRHAPRKKERAKKPDENPATAPESKKERRARSTESPEYWAALYRDITKKIKNFADSGTEESLTAEELTAVMFLNGGETRTIVLEGQRYLLERDITGRFLRIRGYWKQFGKDDQEKSKEDPYIANSGRKDGMPAWKTFTESDLEARKKRKEDEQKRNEDEKRQQDESIKTERMTALRDELDNDIGLIFATDTPPGKRVSFWHIVSKEKVEGSDNEKVNGLQVQLLRKYGDGSVEVRYLEQSMLIDVNGISGQAETTRDEKKTFTSGQIQTCKDEVSAYLNVESKISVTETTSEEKEADRLAYVHKQLDWMAGNLVASSIFPGEEVVFHDDATGGEWVQRVNKDVLGWLGRIQRLMDKEHVTEWEQDPMRGYIGRHIVIRDGRISMLQENPAYNEYRRAMEGRGRKPKKAPEQYLALMKDVRLREDQLPKEEPEKRVA
jgi:hypothetical protein